MNRAGAHRCRDRCLADHSHRRIISGQDFDRWLGFNFAIIRCGRTAVLRAALRQTVELFRGGAAVERPDRLGGSVGGHNRRLNIATQVGVVKTQAVRSG